MRLPVQRIRNLDWRAAVERELQARNSLLPSRIADVATLGHEGIAAELIMGGFIVGRPITPAEVVVAAKSSQGFRPVALLGLPERVIFRCLASGFDPGLPVPARTNEAFAEFKSAPLAISDAAYIAKADVAAYYQYIDHGRLEHELVSQTGDAEISSAILGFLAEVLGRRIGLPQNNETSHLLADLYLDMAERRLHRAGHLVWRYNDDFHFAAPTLRGARRALEDLEASLRDLGLVPSDDKSSIFTRDHYETWINKPARRRLELNENVGGDLSSWICMVSSEYEGEADVEITVLGEDDSDDEEEHVEGAVRALDLWWSYIDRSEVLDPLELYVNRQLARDAIVLLGRHGSGQGISYCKRLIAREPQMTHVVCRYLRTLAIYGHPAPCELVQELVQTSDHLSSWQALWLLEPLWRSDVLQPELVDWVTDLIHEPRSPDPLRARAAFVLAVHSSISKEALGILYESVREASRPDIVAAMAWLSASVEDRDLRAFTDDSPLLEYVAQYVLSRRAAS